jgi:hypothetical protein
MPQVKLLMYPNPAGLTSAWIGVLTSLYAEAFAIYCISRPPTAPASVLEFRLAIVALGFIAPLWLIGLGLSLRAGRHRLQCLLLNWTAVLAFCSAGMTVLFR